MSRAHAILEAVPDGVPDEAWWTASRLGEALEALCIGHRLAAAGGDPVDPVSGRADPAAWFDWAAARMGVEALPVGAQVRDLRAFLVHGGPALIEVGGGAHPGFLALCRSRRGQPVLLCRDGRRVRVRAELVEALLTDRLSAPLRPEIERVLDAAQVAPARRGRVADAMIAERIAAEDVTGLTMLRLPASAGFLAQFRKAGLPARLGQLLGLFALLYAAELWSWSLIGEATLSGRLDWGWLGAWLLLALTMVPWRLMAQWQESVFALETGRLVKSRLLAGALALPPDETRREGTGALIGKVMESQALEGMALGGAFGVLVGLVEIGFAFWVLGMGAAPSAHVWLLGLFTLLTLVMALGYHRRVVAWTRQRLQLTHYLVEAMIGHRTRLAQERASRRDAQEDGQLADYLASARRMDGSALRFGTGLAMAWPVCALLAFAPALAANSTAGGAPGAALLAISLGGIMLAQRALGAIGGGMASLSRAGFAWGQVRAIFRAGGRAAEPGLPGAAGGARHGNGPVIEARGLRYTHQGAASPVLAAADLAIDRGDRVLIEGPSGGGKSTLANLLGGLRQPDGGLLLLGGLDRPTLGDEWHARVACAPQFHDNHVLSGTLAFNLLMGRQWPPGEDDLREAEALCERLGLGELLRRMPGGLHQRVGETGWQLSHGERSRIFLARALLQRADVTILDESFASLDPETMDRCLGTALQEAETLVVIAHP